MRSPARAQASRFVEIQRAVAKKRMRAKRAKGETMEPLPITGRDADREIRSGESNSDSAPTVACEGEGLRPGSSEPKINDESRSLKVVISLAVIVIGAIVIFEIFRVRRHDLLASQAIDLGETFIYSSPLVEEDLGSVQTVKKTREEHRLNPAPGWYLDFDVSGKRRSGVVEMRLQNANGQWHVPSAELKTGHRGPVNLR